MNKIKIITTLLLLSLGGSLFAQEGTQTENNAKASEPVCVQGCTSSEPEVKILNTRNRYTEKGAMQRRMYPRFMHSSIKREKVVCDCNVCHIATASEKKD